MSSKTITILSDSASWLNPSLRTLATCLQGKGHKVALVHSPEDILEGDFAFFLSLGQIVPPGLLRRNKHNLVVHESALPLGRGWSPLTWQILEGSNTIPVTLFEALGEVDCGPILASRTLKFAGTELVDELRNAQAEATVSLCLQFVEEYPQILGQARNQEGQPSYYPRRRPENSRLDPEKTIASQFDLLRVVDNERYPAFFEFRGKKYVIKIEECKK